MSKRYITLAIISLLRKISYNILCFKNIKMNNLSLIEFGVNLSTIGKKSNIVLGKMVHIRTGTEIKASGGKIEIDDSVFINRNCMIVSKEKIKIGQGTTIGPNVMIYDHDHTYGEYKINTQEHFKTGSISIGNNVWIGANCVILKNVTIGDNCVISAGTIIKEDVTPNSLVFEKRIIEKRNII